MPNNNRQLGVSRYLLLPLFLILSMFSSIGQAHKNSVVIPLFGEDEPRLYKRTIFVKATGSPTQNGKALDDALISLESKATKLDPWLVHLGPGEFDITGRTLNIGDGMHLKGSGRALTKIVWNDANRIMVNSDNASMRDLSIEKDYDSSATLLIHGSSTFLGNNLSISSSGFLVMVFGCTVGIENDQIRFSHSTFTVPSSVSDTDLFYLGGNCKATVDFSLLAGTDGNDGIVVLGTDATFIMNNSFLEDESDAVNKNDAGTAICRGIASPTGVYPTACP